MFSLGLFELTLFGLIALVVLGPEKLPAAARALGRWYGMFRRASQRLQHEINSELQLLEATDAIKKELADLRAIEADMKRRMDYLQANLQREHDSLSAQLSLASGSANPVADAPTYDGLDDVQAADEAMEQAHDTSELGAWQQIGTWQTTNTPMTYRFFLLSAYDRHHRLPPAPFLPNYHADKLLYQA